jgi:hypothetical protein
MTWSKAVGRCHAFSPHPLAGALPRRHWPRYWPHVIAAPTAHVVPCTALPRLGAQVTFLTDSKLGYKRVDDVRHACCRATEPPLPPPSVLTARSTSDRFSPQARVAPASLLHQHRSHPRLLATPSRQLAGVITPAAAATGLRRARLPALSPPRVSTQIAPL